MSFKLVLKGTTYFNQAAGTGGEEFEASERPEGDLTEKVLYVHVTANWFGFKSKEVKEGYVSPSAVDACETLGIVYYDPMRHRQEIQRLGAGAYALYRFDT